jgi:hypothetical protein
MKIISYLMFFGVDLIILMIFEKIFSEDSHFVVDLAMFSFWALVNLS